MQQSTAPMASNTSPEKRRLVRKKISVSPVNETSVIKIADKSITADQR